MNEESCGVSWVDEACALSFASPVGAASKSGGHDQFDVPKSIFLTCEAEDACGCCDRQICEIKR